MQPLKLEPLLTLPSAPLCELGGSDASQAPALLVDRIGMAPLAAPAPLSMLVAPRSSRQVILAAADRDSTLAEVASLQRAFERRRYLSSDAAVRAALNELNPLSILMNSEIAFVVIKEPDGFRVGPFTVGSEGAYTIGNLDLAPPPGGTIVGVGHTHGAPYAPQACIACVNTERLSGPDREFATRHQLIVYFSSPRGVFGWYDPTTLRSSYSPEGTIRTR